MKYQIVTDGSPRDVERTVNQLLADGWRLYGSLQMGVSEEDVWFAQAMVLEDGDADDEI